jgi:hypothetical protein
MRDLLIAFLFWLAAGAGAIVVLWLLFSVAVGYLDRGARGFDE